jgi:hypothetical protein
MSYKVAHFDPSQRALEKQESRDRDAARLKQGVVSRDELRRENSFFAGLPLNRYKMVAVGGKSIVRA